MIGEEPESVDKIADDLIGGVDARVLRNSQPNVVKIRFGKRRQPIPAHLVAVFVC
jgi:hypothetical protein